MKVELERRDLVVLCCFVVTMGLIFYTLAALSPKTNTYPQPVGTGYHNAQGIWPQGHGSGLDADMLDGYHVDEIAAALGTGSYCKRTAGTYDGNFVPSGGGDAICQNEFGAGWGFADTDEEYYRIVSVDPAVYRSVFGTISSSFDGQRTEYGWFSCCGKDDCVGWTSSAAGDSGTALRPFEPSDGDTEWDASSGFICSSFHRLWCCPT